MKHGLHKHEHYRRWMNMIQRCYCVSNGRYNTHGAVGIQVCQEWHHHNPEGVKNFIDWCNARFVEYRRHNTPQSNKDVIVCRIDQEKHFTPDNCELKECGSQCNRRPDNVLTKEIVINMRRYRRLNPDSTLTFICELFDVSLANGSRAIRGLTWKCANSEEPPIAEHFTKIVAPVNKKRKNVKCPLMLSSHS